MNGVNRIDRGMLYDDISIMGFFSFFEEILNYVLFFTTQLDKNIIDAT